MRNVIVTGGTRGLGLAICSALAAEDYRVVAIARSESEEFRSAVGKARKNALFFRAFDLTDIPAIAEFVTALCKEFGVIYGLVNNAGIGTPGVLSMMPDRQIELLMRLNVVSPLILTKYVLRSMMVGRAGRIINITSIVASTGYSGLAAYSATKASLSGFTRSLAREVGQLGITVNAVAPGFISTEMTHELRNEQREKIVRRSALKRLATADDVANAVSYLLSDRAGNITGTSLTVDAGSTT